MRGTGSPARSCKERRSRPRSPPRQACACRTTSARGRPRRSTRRRCGSPTRLVRHRQGAASPRRPSGMGAPADTSRGLCRRRSRRGSPRGRSVSAPATATSTSIPSPVRRSPRNQATSSLVCARRLSARTSYPKAESADTRRRPSVPVASVRRTFIGPQLYPAGPPRRSGEATGARVPSCIRPRSVPGGTRRRRTTTAGCRGLDRSRRPRRGRRRPPGRVP